MLRRDFLRLVAAGALAMFVGFGTTACKSETDQVKDAASALLESYVVPVPNEDGEEPEDPAWPAADFGDAATMEVLEKYGVIADDWHRHCFKNFSYELGEASVDGDSATVDVTVTNTSLSAALDAAGADFTAFTETQDSEDTYAQGGKAALFSHLVDLVYAHLDANENPVTTTVSLALTKGDDGWAANVSGSEEFFSALYGGSNVIAGLAPVDEGAEAPAEEPAE
ncbi:hypothetical protein [Thermophilibacter provencensis]|uniref:Uncharacterized protein n=1 Tax=Thermophilibacter provencensis TaxID=1852386 RepID=A0ABT7V559_9ACTN|nr:hypothetical protein [Thermophilibacter provencensis]MDM8271737.1 hypothetical protein [Thermophilibacter provencensis]